jgi:hypothetical protein
MSIGAITNYSVLGASQAEVSGLLSTNYQQGVIPNATVTVYLTGTTTLATIYADSSSTPLSNPFTSGTEGQWLFYALTGAAYDVVLSGGVPPNAYPAPVTFTGLNSGGGSGGGGITSVNTLTGPALTIAVGAGLSVSSVGSTITISLGTAFAITSFTGGSTVEVGTSVANPTFAATYTTTPASANITNTEAIDSPLTLTSPFTSGTVTGTFTHTAPETTIFTLSATQGATLTAAQNINWEWAIFGGVGTAGATSSVTAAGTTAVLSNGNVLPRLQLGVETVGETFGPFNPSGQVIYLLLTGGSHTFIDAGTGFPFAFNAPITVGFVNVNAVTVPLYLYQSTNALYGTYTPKVSS